MKNRFWIALPLAALLTVPALAQQTSPSSQNASQPSSSTDTQAAQQSQNNNSSSASQSNAQPATSQTGDQAAADQQVNREPLKLQTHEGFWGKLNPFARKKYVQRQLGPVTNRINELDELTAKNAKDIQDVDSRAQKGIQMADARASEADQHAVQAGQTAQQAQQTAQQAGQQITTVSNVVSNIDQYKPMTTAEIRFRAGQTMLSKKAKDALDQMASNLKGQRGYIVEIQGFSAGRGVAAIEHSQRMAEAVRRYLVINNDVPVYRVYMLGLGNAPLKTEDGKTERVRGTTVEVSLLKNDLEQLTASNGNAGAAEQQQQAAPASSMQNAAPAQQQQNQQSQQPGIGAQPQQPATTTPAQPSTEKPSATIPPKH